MTFPTCPGCRWPDACPRYRSCIQAERQAGIHANRLARAGIRSRPAALPNRPATDLWAVPNQRGRRRSFLGDVL